MSEAPEQLFAWQDPTGQWHTRFEAEPYEPAVKCKSPSTFYIRADAVDWVPKAAGGTHLVDPFLAGLRLESAYYMRGEDEPEAYSRGVAIREAFDKGIIYDPRRGSPSPCRASRIIFQIILDGAAEYHYISRRRQGTSAKD